MEIDALFHDDVIDWDLIKTHWQDLLRVVLSIKAGKVLPSMLLRKLTSYYFSAIWEIPQIEVKCVLTVRGLMMSFPAI